MNIQACLFAGLTPALGADRPTRRARETRRLAFLALALACLPGLTAGASAAAAPLRVELNSNTVCLVVGPVSDPGALFVLAAPDLPSLAAAPAVMLQTTTPFTNEMRLPIPTAGAFSNGGFFRAAYWAGQAPALVQVPSGTFLMGSPESELERLPCEGPQTMVTLTNDFRMGQYEVTQAQYQALMTNNPSYFTGDSNRPVEQVSWDDAMAYCQLLTAAQWLAGCLPAGWAYRLPTEAEWEYACRAGTTTPFNLGPDLRSGMADFDGCYEYYAALGEVYNPNGIRLWRTADGGQYAPNAWGLYDMHGNLWEWCLDRWTSSLPGGSVTNPTGPAVGSDRVVRGGSWYDAGRWCRSAYRTPSPQSYFGNGTGFRVVLAPPPP